VSSPNVKDLEVRIVWHSKNSTGVCCQEEQRWNRRGP